LSIETVKDRHEADLLRLPNVIGVGIGRRGSQPVIKVFVTQRVPREALGAGEVIPDTLDGYPVSVHVVGTVLASEKDNAGEEG